ncbi:hypothetical protein VTN96DRAFT_10291 [Rasamsonia emersonii]
MKKVPTERTTKQPVENGDIDGIISEEKDMNKDTLQSEGQLDDENAANADPERGGPAPINRDEAPWSIWTPRQKKMIILAASFASLLSPLSGQIYFPALNSIATDLRVSDSLVNLSVTTYMAGPLILLIVIAFCLSASLNCIAVLMVDLYPGKAGTVTASNNLLRCLLGAGATALVLPMINGIGIGWTCSFFGFLNFATTPLLWYVMRQGPKWRAEAQQKKLDQQSKAQANSTSNSNGAVKEY